LLEALDEIGFVRSLDQIVWPVEDEPDRVDADDDEGEELDHGLCRDRQHQSVLMFGRLGTAGAEQGREGGEDQRHPEREVGHACRRRAAAGEQELDRGRDRLELQRDIGQDGHD
jgi:hypothetical protein